MAAKLCWLCMTSPFYLYNPSHLARQAVKQHAKGSAVAFSTTAASLLPAAQANKKGSRPAGPKRGERTTYAPKKKKKVVENKTRPPAPGERKAVRNRVVLTNPNALNVSDVPEFTAEILHDASQGGVYHLPSALVARLRAMEVFKPRQSWWLFQQPSILIRKETIDLAELFKDQSKNGPQSASTARKIIVGDQNSGKSGLLLQAIATAFLKDWIVISIPEAGDLTNGNTDYAPLPHSQPPIYVQKSYTAALLQRISQANPILGDLRVKLSHSLPFPLPAESSLQQLCAMGFTPEHAYPVFLALWEELTAPSRPGILLTLDGLSRAMTESSYMSSAYKPVHAHDLALIAWFMDYLSGKRSLPNGGAVLAATSASNTFPNHTLDMRLRQLEAEQTPSGSNGFSLQNNLNLITPFLRATGQNPETMPQANPFVKYDKRVLEVLGGGSRSTSPGEHLNNGANDNKATGLDVQRSGSQPPQILRVREINREEARRLIEYWARSGMIRARVDDQMVSQKWMLSGSGLIGELEKVCVRFRLS